MSSYDTRYADPQSYANRRTDFSSAINAASMDGGTAANESRGGRGFGSGRGGGRGFDSGRGRFSGGGGRGRGGGKDDLNNIVLPKQSFLGLIPFEKNFYKETAGVLSMTEQEVMEYRKTRDNSVEGNDVPRPIRSFSEANFPGTVSRQYQNVDLRSQHQFSLRVGQWPLREEI